jgi:hypothetical protein
MTTIDNESGRVWARVTLIATLTISVIANVTHAVLAESVIHLGLRIPAAAVWPVLSFLAIEIIVRIVWRSTFAHYLARTFVLGPAIPAVIVSYEHQHALLTMMGENALVSAIGPLAIDGLMIGCTLALLFTRELPASVSALASADDEALAPVTALAETDPVPEVAPEPAAAIESSPRTPRSGVNASVAIAALQSGATPAQAAEQSGLSVQAVRKYAAVIRTLKDNPHAEIDSRKMGVSAEGVLSIRAWARMESVR